MPVPKKLEKTYGKIIGHNINLAKAKGKSKTEAKAAGKKVAEKWLADQKKKGKKTK